MEKDFPPLGRAEMKRRAFTEFGLDFLETKLTDHDLSFLAVYRQLNRPLAWFAPCRLLPHGRL